jgi:hypothetical protein
MDDNKEKKQRTVRQNAALHKYFDLLAKELQSAGLDMRKVLKPEIEIPWTMESVKNQIWRPVQEIMVGKESTTELTTEQIDEIYKVIDQSLGQNHGIHVEFPSEQEMMIRDLYNLKD